MTTCRYYNRPKWAAYPIGDLDTVQIVYFYKNWKAIPLSIFNDYCVVYDDDISIAVCPLTKTIIAVDGKLIFKTERDGRYIFENTKTNEEIDFIDLKKIHEVYVCTLQQSLEDFKDCIYMNYDFSRESSSLCFQKYDYGIIFTSKIIDKNGERIKKTSVFKGDFVSLMKWLNRFSSAASEKNIVVIPTTASYWTKIFPKSEKISASETHDHN